MNPIPVWLQKIWDTWDVRVLVLLSLTLQIILFIWGSRRRFTTGIWISIIVWCAYLTADWVATVALGKLSDITSDELQEPGNSIDPTDELRALWAPLLLLHLGGPDTITAYSIEDNQLWVRHLLGLVVQVTVAIYVILRYWTSSRLSGLTMPLFLAGIIKYGERTWALWYAVREKGTVLHWQFGDTARALIGNIPGVELLRKAYHCFDALKPHIPRWADYHRLTYASVLSMDGYSDTDIFNIIEFELEFMYDVLYTKAQLIYSKAGFILRFSSFFCTEIALWAFLSIAKPANIKEDIFITYVLLLGAVILDIYAVALLLLSDRAIIWMIKNYSKPLVIHVLKVMAPYSLKTRKRWSNSMGQFNLLNYCLKTLNYEPSMFKRILEFFDIDATYFLETKAPVMKELKGQVVQKMREMDRRGSWPFSKRGEWSLGSYTPRRIHEKLKQSVEKEFDKSIILWHLATDICYCNDVTESQPRTMSKLISDYMMYLLVRCPYMLSMVAGKNVFDSSSPNACSSAHNYVHKILKDKGCPITDMKEACTILMNEQHIGETVLRLKDYYYQERWETAKEVQELARILMKVADKWKVMSSVWVEMLCYGASHCQLNYHEQRLRQGGELLTHVWLLLAHLEFDRPREGPIPYGTLPYTNI